MERLDTVVIGAGVVGLAVARELALRGQEVMVLEAASAIGTGTSARSSEVIHAGIYYPKGSLKAKWCVEGKALLYDYCEQSRVSYQRCGKLIVATDAAQLPVLRAIEQAGHANGVHDLQWLTAQQATALEPALHCQAALLSPSTGIVDSHGLMLAMQGDLQAHGGCVVLHTPVRELAQEGKQLCLTTEDGTRWAATRVVNAAGHGAPGLAASMPSFPVRYQEKSYYAKGQYFALSGHQPFKHLIYPIPEPGGLGIHLTLDLAGQGKLGPDVQWVSNPNDYAVDPLRAEGFVQQVQRYWPEVPAHRLHPAYAGLRPKISGPGEPARDFVLCGPAVHGIGGLVHLMGIESPGLTSCLAIATAVASALA